MDRNRLIHTTSTMPKGGPKRRAIISRFKRQEGFDAVVTELEMLGFL